MQENISRRSVLAVLGSVGAAYFAGACSSSVEGASADASSGGGSGDGNAAGGTAAGGSPATGGTGGAVTSSGSGGSSPTSNTTCQVTPEETAGPYPDKLGMLQDSEYFRKDITEGKTGLPLTLTLTVSNTNGSCAPLANAAVEIWHCDADGNYSEYTQPGYDGTGETFLRGIQTTDRNGQVTFTTIYPGWYAGRVTHIHLQVYVSGKVVKTSQIAFDEATTSAVYKTAAYSTHGQSPLTNAADMVFSDGDEYELATLKGSTTSGYTATLDVGVAV